MKLSLKVEYACRVLAQLARRYGDDGLAHIETLAAAEDVPANYLIQILNDLRNGGLIMSRRGKQGGYALARVPGEITLQEILTVMDGGILEHDRNAGGESGARVSRVWCEVAAALEKKTADYNLESFLPVESSDMYYI